MSVVMIVGVFVYTTMNLISEYYNRRCIITCRCSTVAPEVAASIDFIVVLINSLQSLNKKGRIKLSIGVEIPKANFAQGKGCHMSSLS